MLLAAWMAAVDVQGNAARLVLLLRVARRYTVLVSRLLIIFISIIYY
jgi:hypothetical protein